MNAAILHCLRANLANATTPAMRDFARGQLDQYLKRHTPKPKLPQPNWEKLTLP